MSVPFSSFELFQAPLAFLSGKIPDRLLPEESKGRRQHAFLTLFQWESCFSLPPALLSPFFSPFCTLHKEDSNTFLPQGTIKKTNRHVSSWMTKAMFFLCALFPRGLGGSRREPVCSKFQSWDRCCTVMKSNWPSAKQYKIRTMWYILHNSRVI